MHQTSNNLTLICLSLFSTFSPLAANLSPTDQCFQHEKGVSLESRYEGTKIFTPCPQKIGFRAQKRPNWAKNWHFWPNIGIFGPFDPMPDQKTMRTSCLGVFFTFTLCLYFYLYLPLANQRLSINYPPFVLQLGLGATEQKSHCLTSHQATSSRQTTPIFSSDLPHFPDFSYFSIIFSIFFRLFVFSSRLKFLQIIFPHTLHSDKLPLEYCTETRFLFSRVNFHPRIARPL